jgi:hypothetical protein
MTREPDENRNPFSGLREGQPPEELRSRVLQAAGEAFRTEAAPDFWTAIWESRPARLAWSTAVVLLAVSHLMVPGESTPRMARSTAVENEELRAVTALPRLSLDARPVAGMLRRDVAEPNEETEENAS